MVLEAHVLAALCKSMEFMVLIGDDRQLRPAISSYNLSMDSRSGRVLALDKSLLERMSSEAQFPMPCLQIQRRMRPEISRLIRDLYPTLQDHPSTLQQPPLRGFALPQSVAFFDHGHGEEAQDTNSRSNRFEALMIRDIVLHLIRQVTIYLNQ